MSDIRNRVRVYKSGAAKRKEQKQKEEGAKKLRESLQTLDRFNFSNKNTHQPPQQDLSHDEVSGAKLISNRSNICTDSKNDSEYCKGQAACSNINTNSCLQNDPLQDSDGACLPGVSGNGGAPPQILNTDELEQSINLHDPATWCPIGDNTRLFLVKNGPPEQYQGPFPYDEGKRRFTSDNYFKMLKNKEKVCRFWLIYSQHSDAIFCFCCKIFNSSSKSLLVTTGFRSWQYMHKTLEEHEYSSTHVKSMTSWIELEQRLRTDTMIDQTVQTLIVMERKHLTGVIERLIAIVLLLAAQNQAFRGSSDVLYTPSNGNFLAQVEFLAKFDSTMNDHVRRFLAKEKSNHYLSHEIQNKLIRKMSTAISDRIIASIKQNKYYSIILDCTPDISHQEQLSVIVRFVDMSGSGVSVQEHFMGFLIAEKGTGEYLSETVLQFLQERDIQFTDCRGQGYDNGANMRGHNNGVQARLLRLNSRAFFVPCGCHSLNLVLCDACMSSTWGKTFFGILQRFYTIFSASTSRWAILKSCVDISLKPLSDTRWESKIDSIKAVRYQTKQLTEALSKLREETNDAKVYSEAGSLSEQLQSYKFLVSVIIWHDILFDINVISKQMQSADCQMDIAANLLKITKEKLTAYREMGFNQALATAKELAEELSVTPEFPITRVRTKKRMATYEGVDEIVADAQDRFRTEFFLVVVDTALTKLDERFSIMNQYCATFSFLSNIKAIAVMEQNELRRFCADLQIILTIGDDTDLDAVELEFELKNLSCILPTNLSALKTLSYIAENKLVALYPNTCIALRIFLTAPVTVAAAERSFSKLKLIKTYLRSNMSQDRLTGLAIISIEKEIAAQTSYESIIKNMVERALRSK